MKTKFLIAQLGSPENNSVSAVRKYLREFLSDPRVIDLNPWVWKIILNLFILPFRPKKSAHAYSFIWDGQSFPLVSITNSLTEKIKRQLSQRSEVEVESCFLLSYPRPVDIFAKWNKESVHSRAQHLFVWPQFPQYAESTVAAVFDVLGQSIKHQVNIPSVSFLKNYHCFKPFIDLSVLNIQEQWNFELQNSPSLAPEHLVISFHGIPLRRVKEKRDEYYRHCLETFDLIKNKLSIDPNKIHLTFQSKFGSEIWLGPATDKVAEDLAKSGVKKILFYCASFTVDCLETTVEIGVELREELAPLNAEVVLVPCLNDMDPWVSALSEAIIFFHEHGISQFDKLCYPPPLDLSSYKDL